MFRDVGKIRIKKLKYKIKLEQPFITTSSALKEDIRAI